LKVRVAKGETELQFKEFMFSTTVGSRSVVKEVGRIRAEGGIKYRRSKTGLSV
jgi:hypothetical protein